MSFYIRKSFRMGPVRLNVSKGGLGVSAGVRGARLGVNSRGRAYVHAGRHGAYYRKEFGSGSSTRPSSALRSRAGRSEPVVLFHRTDAAYTPEWAGPQQQPLSAPGSPRIDPKYGWGGIAAGALLALFGSNLGLLLGSLLAIGGTGYLVWAYGRNRARNMLRGRLAALAADRNADEQRWLEVQSSLSSGQFSADLAGAEVRRAYLDACRRIVEDGVVEESELKTLFRLENLLEDVAFAHAAKVDAFRGLWFAAVADHDLDEQEEKTLDHVRQYLAVSAEDVREELDFLDRLRELRAVRSGELQEVDPPVPIQKSEKCYFAAQGRFLKEKQLRAFQEDGQKYKVRGLVEDKEGTLLITNKRVLLVHTGTSTVRHDKILDIELDMDENTVRLTKDGAKTPTILSTPDAVRAAAIIGVLSGVEMPRSPG